MLAGPDVFPGQDMSLAPSVCCADLHPGNILVAFDSPPVPLLSSAAYIVDRFKPFGWKVPSSWREPAIVLLDVGAFLPAAILCLTLAPVAPFVASCASACLAKPPGVCMQPAFLTAFQR